MAIASLADLQTYLETSQMYTYGHPAADRDGLMEALAAEVLLRDHGFLLAILTGVLADEEVAARGIAAGLITPMDALLGPHGPAAVLSIGSRPMLGKRGAAKLRGHVCRRSAASELSCCRVSSSARGRIQLFLTGHGAQARCPSSAGAPMDHGACGPRDRPRDLLQRRGGGRACATSSIALASVEDGPCTVLQECDSGRYGRAILDTHTGAKATGADRCTPAGSLQRWSVLRFEATPKLPWNSRLPLAPPAPCHGHACSALGLNQAGSNDPMLDLAPSGSVGVRGASQRAKFQEDLASGKGTFFAQVLANLTRRMQPALVHTSTPRCWERALEGMHL